MESTTNKMNKEDYLRKKGMLPEKDFGTLFVFKSTPKGVGEIAEQLIWGEREGKWISSDDGKERKYKNLSLRDYPFECELFDNEIVGENRGVGSGVGDLWSWSYFYSRDREALEKKRVEEKDRVEKKYALKTYTREILFRGVGLYGEGVGLDGQFVYGYLVNPSTIRTQHGLDRTVDPSSVCQYIGLKDKNDKHIFERDIVHVVKDKFGPGLDEIWRIEYASFGDAQFYVVNGINSCREIQCDQINWFTTDGNDQIELEVIGYFNE